MPWCPEVHHCEVFLSQHVTPQEAMQSWQIARLNDINWRIAEALWCEMGMSRLQYNTEATNDWGRDSIGFSCLQNFHSGLVPTYKLHQNRSKNRVSCFFLSIGIDICPTAHLTGPEDLQGKSSRCRGLDH